MTKSHAIYSILTLFIVSKEGIIPETFPFSLNKNSEILKSNIKVDPQTAIILAAP